MSPNEINMMWLGIGFAAGMVVCAVAAMAVWPDLRIMRTRGRG